MKNVKAKGAENSNADLRRKLSAQHNRSQNTLRWFWIISMMLVLVGLSALKLG